MRENREQQKEIIRRFVRGYLNPTEQEKNDPVFVAQMQFWALVEPPYVKENESATGWMLRVFSNKMQNTCEREVYSFFVEEVKRYEKMEDQRGQKTLAPKVP